MNAAGIIDTPTLFDIGSFTLIDSELTVNGVLSGSRNLTKTGGGTLIFTNTNTNTGALIVSGGTVAVKGNGALSQSSLVNLASSGVTLDISAANNPQTIAGLTGVDGANVNLGTQSLTFGGGNTNTTYAGSFSGSGTLTKVGTGTATLAGDSPGFTGPINVNAGTLLVNGNMGIAGLTTVGNATLGGTGTLGNVTITSAGTLAPSVLTPTDTTTKTLTVNDLTLDPGSQVIVRANDLGANERIWVNGAFTDHGTLWIDAIAGKYVGQAYGPFITVGGAPDPGNWDIRQKFLTWDPGPRTITRNEDFFKNLAATHNQREVARVLDLMDVQCPKMWEVMTRLSQIPTPAEQRAAFNQMTGDLRAHAIMLGQWKTSQYGLAHLDLTEHGFYEKESLWFRAIHQTTDVESDGNASAYGISRTGGVVGHEEMFGDDTTLGLLIGFSQPYVYNQGNSVNANDLQFGFYSGTRISRFLDTKMFVGVGHQYYEQKRYITDSYLLDNGPIERIDATYTGDSMSMSWEFGVPIEGNLVSLRPVMAIDSDLTWVYNASETGTTGLELSYAREFYDKTLFRTGLTAQLGSVRYATPLSLFGRFFYARQIGGNPYTTSRAAFSCDLNQTMTIFGVDQGKDYISGGLGFRWTLSESRSLFGDYDLTTTDRSQMHYASLGYIQKW